MVQNRNHTNIIPIIIPSPLNLKKITPHPQQQEGINHLPPYNSLKLGFLNVNGLYTSNEDRMLEVLDFISQNNIDIFGLAETNLNWNNGETYKKQQRKLRRLTNDPKAQLITSDTNIPWTRQFKPGGTALIINSKVASHVSNKDSDYPLGRWSLIDLQHKNTKICICSAYIVGNN